MRGRLTIHNPPSSTDTVVKKKQRRAIKLCYLALFVLWRSTANKDLERQRRKAHPNRQPPSRSVSLRESLFQSVASIFWRRMAVESMFFEPKAWSFQLDGLEPLWMGR